MPNPQPSPLRRRINAQKDTIKRLEWHGDFPEARKERVVLSGLYIKAGLNPDGSPKKKLPPAGSKAQVVVPNHMKPYEEQTTALPRIAPKSLPGPIPRATSMLKSPKGYQMRFPSGHVQTWNHAPSATEMRAVWNKVEPSISVFPGDAHAKAITREEYNKLPPGYEAGYGYSGTRGHLGFSITTTRKPGPSRRDEQIRMQAEAIGVPVSELKRRPEYYGFAPDLSRNLTPKENLTYLTRKAAQTVRPVTKHLDPLASAFGRAFNPAIDQYEHATGKKILPDDLVTQLAAGTMTLPVDLGFHVQRITTGQGFDGGQASPYERWVESPLHLAMNLAPMDLPEGASVIGRVLKTVRRGSELDPAVMEALVREAKAEDLPEAVSRARAGLSPRERIMPKFATDLEAAGTVEGPRQLGRPNSAYRPPGGALRRFPVQRGSQSGASFLLRRRTLESLGRDYQRMREDPLSSWLFDNWKRGPEGLQKRAEVLSGHELRGPNGERSFPHKSGLIDVEKGYPYWNGWVQSEQRFPLTGSRRLDREIANHMAGFELTPEDFVWHHNEDAGLMQLVPRWLHEMVGHTGGYAVELRHFEEYLNSLARGAGK